ncbi:glutamate formimidoyltransferase [Clostridium sp. CM028]|uniref:glutamate formimidoyltransferase n=1 Tax=unclassified Clostridium TaxID=2614128 RepID=UPI001C0AD0FA|nr:MULTISPECIES: glutamate formimidoyltransferase [unclassified Clostridium]MBU3091105.1 glutamate formimidoyltransferase [Clostridium sp. CF011]MBW9144913.1 glutamate formimidoyltransferase [Clostridium sp. CM027]MBW9148668.1 glutamate formimidoyltransferase [Clostridium sp. CM028]UVE40054.1 glutamate formimidoyltransferase [Clostridium sp. CM027]WAG68978.1 glutamate formimidoyltransferase [Clostridium sp. CF011]
MLKLVECVPNFSEGRNKQIIESIVDEIRNTENVKLLDYSSDKDHNRTVVTFVASPEDAKKAAFKLIKRASELIDMRTQEGAHPRMGATDVVPFIPIQDITTEECVEMAKELGKKVGEELNIPVYLYEDAATCEARRNLAKIRKGQYEGFFEKIKLPEWKPDFGPCEMNEKSGCIVIGARFPLVAYNVNLGTDNMEIATAIAKKVRFIGGGLRFVKAMGVKLCERNIVQISMNLVNYEKTAVYRAHEMVKMEALRYGVPVVGSEVIGLVPLKALIDCAEYYLQIENFDISQILEKKLSE